jgi:hypothetical protein
MEIEKSSGALGFKKNLSMISIDGNGNPTSATVHPPTAS